MSKANHEVIDLIDSDDDCKPAAKPSAVQRQEAGSDDDDGTKSSASLPASLVLDEDQVSSQEQHDLVAEFCQARQSDPSLLFQDPDFTALPSSIRGMHKTNQPNCRCKGSKQAKLQYKKADGRPYYSCATSSCQYFSWAFQAERMHWYRFGPQTTGHEITKGGRSFSASDLCQGKVGDCWFLSALAVVAERPDLMARLVPSEQPYLNQGLVQVNLFLDGNWETVVMDNFLPCLVDSKSESTLQQALQASMGIAASASTSTSSSSSSSQYDPFAIADACRQTLRKTQEFLQQHQRQTFGKMICSNNSNFAQPLQRQVTSHDLAYSTAKFNQLWVPFLEKAYAKSHGCYSAISGGHIAEAFLDLTGAPTEVYQLHGNGFSPRSFWYKLLQYRRQQLPMGCGTDNSAAGIIGMHAYSILDVKEIKNVPFSFFHETGVSHGNVSGFTEYDGTVRLLQIRNPHGKGEWKGDFSDQSQIWERLLQHGSGANASGLQRTMKNDGTFYIDYDNFLMAFANVDVVLCHKGNHAKSFATNFAAKKSNHRCARAFEVSLLDEQPGLPNRDTVELFIMGIQKTRRGATSGRADRKKSYKVSDLGMLVGEGRDENQLAVKGQMFGFRRDGHYRLILDRKKTRRMVVMPISFGHPAATDKELPFTLRFVSDAPLLIRELPEVPRMDLALQRFCLDAPQLKGQGVKKILLEDPRYRLVQVDCCGNRGGVVFLFLWVNETKFLDNKQGGKQDLSFAVEANCRGMSCRTESGLLEHKTVAKGKKFEAAWRRYSAEFVAERKSRLLLVLYQSGQDTEFGSINCKSIATPRKLGTSGGEQTTLRGFVKSDKDTISDADTYDRRGIFNSVPGGAFAGAAATRLQENVAEDQQDLDGELERALALSRGDLELQQAIEASRQISMGNQHGARADFELQQALERSKSETRAHEVISIDHAPVSGVASSNSSAYDDELARAIQLSLQPKASPSQVVDLTDEPHGASLPAKRTIDAVDKTDDQTPLDQADKRRLAAEAALKRLQR